MKAGAGFAAARARGNLVSMLKRIVVLLSVFSCGLALGQSAYQDEAVHYLQEYVRINTSNPPGRTIEAAHFLKGILDKEGIPVTIYESVPGQKANLVARLKATRPSGKKPLLMLNHMDVVPADPSRWPVDPFSGVIKDGYIWGRGTMDMKGHGITQLMTLVLLKRNHVALDRDVILLSVSDEEIGGDKGARWMIENHYPGLDPEYVIDEGGVGFKNMLAPGKTVFGIAVTEKRVLWLRLRAEGSAGHGSQPIKDNANEILMRALNRILARPEPRGDDPVLNELIKRVGRLADNKFTRAIQHNTISLTTLQAGVGNPPKVNVIPSVSTATLDCRLLPGQSTQQFLADLRRRINNPAITVEKIYESVIKDPSPMDSPLFETMERVLKKHYPNAVVSPLIIPYGTDSASFRLKGAKGYGILPVIVGPDILGSLHSDNEKIPVDAFKQGIGVFYDIISSFVGSK